MRNGLSRYPTYRRSGLSWLGDMPSHWELRRAKTTLQSVDVRSGTGAEDLLTVSSQRGVVLRSTAKVTMFQAESYVGHKLCWPGDLVINSLWAWSRGLGVSRHFGIVSSAYGVYRARSSAVDPWFLHHFVRSSPYSWELRVRSKGVWTSRLQLTDDAFLAAPVLVPPRDEQAAIVRYLNHLDRQVSRLVEGKRRVIGAMQEQRRRRILTAITRGVSPSTPLRASGVDWIGDCPEHWDVRRLKWVLLLQRGYDLPAQDRQSGDVPVVSSGGVIDTHAVSKATGPGVVLGRYGSTESVYFIEQDYWPHNTSLFTTSMRGNNPRWCYYLMTAMSKADHSGKSAVPGLDRKDLFDVRVPMPPVEEQSAIAQTLDRDLALVDRVVTGLKREVELLAEYRTRAVADVVTGRVDICDVAASLSDSPAPALEAGFELGLEDDGESELDSLEPFAEV